MVAVTVDRARACSVGCVRRLLRVLHDPPGARAVTQRAYALGERVWASHSGTGFPRPGVVSTVAEFDGIRATLGGDLAYGVHFDGDDGPSFPCVIIRAERGLEAASPRIGTGS